MKGEKSKKTLEELGGVAPKQKVVMKFSPKGKRTTRGYNDFSEAVKNDKILIMNGETKVKKNDRKDLWEKIKKREIKNNKNIKRQPNTFAYLPECTVQRKYSELNGNLAKMNKSIINKKNEDNYIYTATTAIPPRIKKELKKHGRCRTIEKNGREIIIQTSKS